MRVIGAISAALLIVGYFTFHAEGLIRLALASFSFFFFAILCLLVMGTFSTALDLSRKNDKVCMVLERDLIVAKPKVSDAATKFQALACRPQGVALEELERLANDQRRSVPRASLPPAGPKP
jgi:hypothetical protein